MKLIQENQYQRFYQLDFKVKNHFGIGKQKTISKLWENNPINLINDFELDEDISESIDKICVSDARNHIERLVFPAFWIKNKKTDKRKLCHIRIQIDGKLTFKIHGGDQNSVYSDKVYIRHLRLANRSL